MSWFSFVAPQWCLPEPLNDTCDLLVLRDFSGTFHLVQQLFVRTVGIHNERRYLHWGAQTAFLNGNPAPRASSFDMGV